jgi:hypothetical protein
MLVKDDRGQDNTLKTLAIAFGVVLLLVGLLGFVPQAKTGDDLFGLFRVNTEHNLIHILSGVAGILCGINSEYASRLFFQVFGVIYGLITLLGLYYQNQDMFGGLIAHNVHDVWLHALISAASLYLGFVYRHDDRVDNDQGL